MSSFENISFIHLSAWGLSLVVRPFMWLRLLSRVHAV
jgi:hypothetical protein